MMTRKEIAAFRKLVDRDLVCRYGKNGNSAWAHMSGNHREDARMAMAAHLILMQSHSIAERMTLVDAQEILREVGREENTDAN